jgi:hypothetical protein
MASTSQDPGKDNDGRWEGHWEGSILPGAVHQRHPRRPTSMQSQGHIHPISKRIVNPRESPMRSYRASLAGSLGLALSALALLMRSS